MGQFYQYLSSELQFVVLLTLWAPEDSLLENLQINEVNISLPHPLQPKPLETVNSSCVT